MTRPRPLTDRFHEKVNRSDDNNACWEWLGARRGPGYGVINPGAEREGAASTMYAHRLAFKLHNGYLPPVVRHTCDNPPCCNPAHLEPGDIATNNRDKADRNRIKGSRNPAAKLTGADVLEIRASDAPAKILAHHYGVTPALINLVRARKVWAHV